jgi:hypothetical protein
MWLGWFEDLWESSLARLERYLRSLRDESELD